MKLRIIIGSLLAIILIVMLPFASTAESDIIKKTMDSEHSFIIQDIDIEKLKQKYLEDPPETSIITITLFIWFLRFLRGLFPNIIFKHRFLSKTIDVLYLIRGFSFIVKAILLFSIINKIFGNNTSVIY